MKPTEKEIEVAAKAIAFTQLTTTAELTEQEIKTIGDKIWQNHKVSATAALNAAYAVREADTVEVVTGEPEEEDVGMDNRGNFARFTTYADERSRVPPHWIPENRLDGFDEDSYTIIMRNGKVVLDKREKQ